MSNGTEKMSCPKCGGNVFFERNTTYNYARKQNERTGWCLQCGKTVYMSVDNDVNQELSVTTSGK